VTKRLFKILPALLIPGILVAILLFISKNREAPEEILVQFVDTMEIEPVIIREYGLRVDSFHITNGIIKRNQTLSTILYEYGVSNQTLHDLADKYSVSAERIRQLEANAMKKMKGALIA